MRRLFLRYPLLTIVIAYLLAGALGALAVGELLRGRWGLALFLLGLGIGAWAGFRAGLAVQEVPMPEMWEEPAPTPLEATPVDAPPAPAAPPARTGATARETEAGTASEA